MKKADPYSQTILQSDMLINPENVKKSLNKTKFPELRIVFFGTPEFSVIVLDEIAKKYDISAVVTSPDKPIGRKQTLTESPVSKYASENGIPALKPVKLNEAFIESNFAFLNADLYIVASYGKIIPQSLLDIPKFGAINIHPSLLPLFRGPSPLQASILSGDKQTGVTIIKMDAEMDHGPIILQKEYTMSDNDNYLTLGNKLFQLGSERLVAMLPDFIQGKIDITNQNHHQATYCKMIKKEDAYFDIEKPPTAEELDRMIRAYFPWPVAWTIWRIKNQELRIKLMPNNMIQVEGKMPVSLKEFLNGYPAFPIKSLK